MCESGRRLPHVYRENTMVSNASNPDCNIRGDWHSFLIPWPSDIVLPQNIAQAARPMAGQAGETNMSYNAIVGYLDHGWVGSQGSETRS